jgi:hypothetical protein
VLMRGDNKRMWATMWENVQKVCKSRECCGGKCAGKGKSQGNKGMIVQKQGGSRGRLRGKMCIICPTADGIGWEWGKCWRM